MIWMQRKLSCAHTFDARSTLPATRWGSAVVDAALFAPDYEHYVWSPELMTKAQEVYGQ